MQPKKRDWEEFEAVDSGVEWSEGCPYARPKLYFENDTFLCTWSLVAYFIDKTVHFCWTSAEYRACSVGKYTGLRIACMFSCVQGFPGGSKVKTSACSAGDLGLIPGSGRSPGEGNGNPLQYSWLENPMDRGAWWATVHGVTKSQTQVSDLTSVVSNSFWPYRL